MYAEVSNPLSSDSESNKVVLGIASIDSNAMLKDLAVGAQSDVSGFVAMLGAMDALKNHSFQLLPRTIAFLFLDAEAWAYSGSRKFVTDHADFLTNISAIVEARQVIVDDSKHPTYYVHKEKHGDYGNASKLVDALVESSKGLSIEISSEVDADTDGVPPASLQTFLRVAPSLKGVVVTNHAGPYKNQFYHSIFDNGEFSGANSEHTMKALCHLSTSLARSLYTLATDDAFPQV